MSKNVQVPANPLMLFTNAETGHRVAVSSMWIKIVEETDRGTVITIADVPPVTVEESFPTVLYEFTEERYRSQARQSGKRPRRKQ